MTTRSLKEIEADFSAALLAVIRREIRLAQRPAAQDVITVTIDYDQLAAAIDHDQLDAAIERKLRAMHLNVPPASDAA